MRKLIFAAFALSVLSMVALSPAYASIFMNFDDSPNFTPDIAVGNTAHTYASPYGMISFNGRIWDEIDSKPYADHTTGSDYFLKNVDAVAGRKVTMTFDFDVDNISLYWLGITGAHMHGAAYDINGDIIGSEGSATGTGSWVLQTINNYSGSNPIRSIAFWSTNAAGSTMVGNRMAIDDITINPKTPEPASLLLLGIGLIPILKRFKRA